MSRLWASMTGLCLATTLVATGAVAQSTTTAASEPPAPAVSTPLVYDPWEPVNRGLFSVGMAADKAVIGPIAHGYMRVTPLTVQNRVSSVVYNLGEPSTAIEDLLQGRPKRSGRATVRFVVNSTVGMLGLFDVASKWGIDPHQSDFGQTLGRYGAPPGPYVYVPIVGPLNLRDGIGRIVDVVTDPVGQVIGPVTSTSGAIGTGATMLDLRASTDPALRALDDATDPYVTARSAYSQYRAAVVAATTGATTELPDFDPEASLP